jgi:hypothetical protein
MVVGYVAGSGFSPLISGFGTYASGRTIPGGGLQIIADPSNSGSIYVSLSGAFVFSGQVGLLVSSGGPTISSGAMPLSGGISSGLMDGLKLNPGASFLVPKICIQNALGGTGSGTLQVCLGSDTAGSGAYSRVYWEFI